MPWENRQNSLRARQLRNQATEAERRLWQRIRSRQVCGVRFNRQVCVGSYICYICDFAARSLKLVIELDGGQHDHNRAADQNRSRFLESRGFHVIRFWNHEVMENLDGVVEAIRLAILALPQPLPHAGGEQVTYLRTAETP